MANGVLVLAVVSQLSLGATVPFTEEFASGSANWADAATALNLDWVSVGGPDGSSYVSDEQDFAAREDGASVVLFRAHLALGSSGGALAGNWIDEGVGQFSAWVRHELPVPALFFTRFASPFNFPGAIAAEFSPVLPHTWTRMQFDISPTNPAFVSYEGSDFPTIFANIGNVQVGVTVPAGFGLTSTAYRFNFDKASITAVPESPMLAHTAGFLTLLAMGSVFRRWYVLPAQYASRKDVP